MSKPEDIKWINEEQMRTPPPENIFQPKLIPKSMMQTRHRLYKARPQILVPRLAEVPPEEVWDGSEYHWMNSVCPQYPSHIPGLDQDMWIRYNPSNWPCVDGDEDERTVLAYAGHVSNPAYSAEDAAEAEQAGLLYIIPEYLHVVYKFTSLGAYYSEDGGITFSQLGGTEPYGGYLPGYSRPVTIGDKVLFIAPSSYDTFGYWEQTQPGVQDGFDSLSNNFVTCGFTPVDRYHPSANEKKILVHAGGSQRTGLMLGWEIRDTIINGPVAGQVSDQVGGGSYGWDTGQPGRTDSRTGLPQPPPCGAGTGPYGWPSVYTVEREIVEQLYAGATPGNAYGDIYSRKIGDELDWEDSYRISERTCQSSGGDIAKGQTFAVKTWNYHFGVEYDYWWNNGKDPCGPRYTIDNDAFYRTSNTGYGLLESDYGSYRDEIYLNDEFLQVDEVTVPPYIPSISTGAYPMTPYEYGFTGFGFNYWVDKRFQPYEPNPWFGVWNPGEVISVRRKWGYRTGSGYRFWTIIRFENPAPAAWQPGNVFGGGIKIKGIARYGSWYDNYPVASFGGGAVAPVPGSLAYCTKGGTDLGVNAGDTGSWLGWTGMPDDCDDDSNSYLVDISHLQSYFDDVANKAGPIYTAIQKYFLGQMKWQGTRLSSQSSGIWYGGWLASSWSMGATGIIDQSERGDVIAMEEVYRGQVYMNASASYAAYFGATHPLNSPGVERVIPLAWCGEQKFIGWTGSHGLPDSSPGEFMLMWSDDGCRTWNEVDPGYDYKLAGVIEAVGFGPGCAALLSVETPSDRSLFNDPGAYTLLITRDGGQTYDGFRTVINAENQQDINNRTPINPVPGTLHVNGRDSFMLVGMSKGVVESVDQKVEELVEIQPGGYSFRFKLAPKPDSLADPGEEVIESIRFNNYYIAPSICELIRDNHVWAWNPLDPEKDLEQEPEPPPEKRFPEYKWWETVYIRIDPKDLIGETVIPLPIPFDTTAGVSVSYDVSWVRTAAARDTEPYNAPEYLVLLKTQDYTVDPMVNEIELNLPIEAIPMPWEVGNPNDLEERGLTALEEQELMSAEIIVQMTVLYKAFVKYTAHKARYYMFTWVRATGETGYSDQYFMQDVAFPLPAEWHRHAETDAPHYNDYDGTICPLGSFYKLRNEWEGLSEPKHTVGVIKKTSVPIEDE